MADLNPMLAMAQGSNAALQLQKNMGEAPYATEKASTEAQSDISVAKLQKLTADTKMASLLAEPEYEKQVVQTMQGIYGDPSNKGKSPSELTTMAAQKLMSTAGNFKSFQLGESLMEKATTMQQKEAITQKAKLEETSAKIDSAKVEFADAPDANTALSLLYKYAQTDPAVALRVAPVAKMLQEGGDLNKAKEIMDGTFGTWKEKADFAQLKLKAVDEKRKEQKDQDDKDARAKSEARLQQGMEDREKEAAKRDAATARREDLAERRFALMEKKAETVTAPKGDAKVGERTYNITENFGQATKDIVNIATQPKDSMLGTFAGLTGTSGTGLVDALSRSFARRLTKSDERSFEQLVAGLESSVASVLGGGSATAASVGRMKQYEKQMPRENDSPEAAAVFLARIKQELHTAAENFPTRPGVSKEQIAQVNKYVADLDKAVPWSVEDINKAKTVKTGTVGEQFKKKYQPAGEGKSQFKGTGTAADPIQLG